MYFLVYREYLAEIYVRPWWIVPPADARVRSLVSTHSTQCSTKREEEEEKEGKRYTAVAIYSRSLRQAFEIDILPYPISLRFFSLSPCTVVVVVSSGAPFFSSA